MWQMSKKQQQQQNSEYSTDLTIYQLSDDML